MAVNVAKEVAAMERMTPKELQARYAEVFGEQPRSRNKQWLIKRIAWRMQANAEGDLSERARRRPDGTTNLRGAGQDEEPCGAGQVCLGTGNGATAVMTSSAAPGTRVRWRNWLG